MRGSLPRALHLSLLVKVTLHDLLRLHRLLHGV